MLCGRRPDFLLAQPVNGLGSGYASAHAVGKTNVFRFVLGSANANPSYIAEWPGVEGRFCVPSTYVPFTKARLHFVLLRSG